MPFIETICRTARENKIFRTILSPVLAIRHLGSDKRESELENHYRRLFQFVEGGSLIVRVPQFRGSFEIDGRSSLLKRLLKRGFYEPRIVDVVVKHLDPNRDAIDIGANIGFFTVLLAKSLDPKRRVLSVEPAPQALKYLRGNIKRNRVDESVVLYEGVAMNAKGSFDLHVISGKEEYASVFEIGSGDGQNGGIDQDKLQQWMEHAGITGKEAVPIRTEGDTVDNLVERFGLEPGVIKIDAEGAEHQILLSAVKTLARWKPVILSELVDFFLSKSGVSSKTVIQLLEENGYEVFDAEAPEKPISSFFVGTILAVPRLLHSGSN